MKILKMSSRPMCEDCGDYVTLGSCSCGKNNFIKNSSK